MSWIKQRRQEALAVDFQNVNQFGIKIAWELAAHPLALAKRLQMFPDKLIATPVQIEPRLNLDWREHRRKEADPAFWGTCKYIPVEFNLAVRAGLPEDVTQALAQALMTP